MERFVCLEPDCRWLGEIRTDGSCEKCGSQAVVSEHAQKFERAKVKKVRKKK